MQGTVVGAVKDLETKKAHPKGVSNSYLLYSLCSCNLVPLADLFFFLLLEQLVNFSIKCVSGTAKGWAGGGWVFFSIMIYFKEQ